jgi:catechol 2,3-dioxygenase-like lactoylglutathione lyase family enzyme
VKAKPNFFQVQGLRQIRIPVTNLDRSIRWYAENLGLEVALRNGRHIAFLSIPESNHTLVLNAIEPKTQGRLHFTFAISGGQVSVEAWRLRLRKMGVPFSVRTRGAGVSALFLTDPDGYTVEITSD